MLDTSHFRSAKTWFDKCVGRGASKTKHLQ